MTREQHHPRPLHRIRHGEAALAPAQIRPRRSDAHQSGTHKCVFCVREYCTLRLPQFASIGYLDYEDAADKELLQQLDIAVGREVEEYAAK